VKRQVITVLPLAILFLLLAWMSSAAADVSLCPAGTAAGQCNGPRGLAVDRETGRLYVADSGNQRVDVFNADRSFALAFGWGVVDGAAELQACGPSASPPTATCQKGLEGPGAGQFSDLRDIAVDSDPASPANHDVYLLDGPRVQRFTPEGDFVLMWGGGVITGGASGTANLTVGSKEATAVKTATKRFYVGQQISGVGVPPGARIAALGNGTITLSKPVTASGTAVPISSPEGPGNLPVNEVQTLSDLKPAANPPLPTLGFTTPNPTPTQAAVQIDYADPPPATGPGSLEESLESLPNIGVGNVSVTGPTGGPYVIEFTGPRFADTDVPQLTHSGPGGATILTKRNGGGGYEICTALIAASCAAGIHGGGEGQFEGQSDRGPRLALGPGGVVYIVNCVTKGVFFEENGGCQNRLQKFTPSGSFLAEIPLPQRDERPKAVAVDSTGDFYVSFAGDSSNPALFEIYKYDSAGSLLGHLPGPGGSVSSLAIDAEDNLYSGETERDHGGSEVIAEYDPAMNTLRRFGYGVLNGSAIGLAAYSSAEGDVYTSEESASGSRAFYRAVPAPGPIVLPRACETTTLGNTSATLHAVINPEGKATTFQFEFLTQSEFEAGGFSGAQKTAELDLPEPVDFHLHDAAVKVEGLEPETQYRCRVIAKNADGEAPAGQDGVFKTKEGFEFGSLWASDVLEQSATVNVEGNPLGIPAKGQIEYVDDAKFQASGFVEALQGPPGEIDFGASEEMQLRSVTLEDLIPGTTYHYRLHVKNGAPPEGILCPERKATCPSREHTLRTYNPEPAEADHRRPELVSPGEKNSAEVAVPDASGGLFEDRTIRVQAAAGSGEAITYTSFTSFGDAEGAPATSQYLARRTPGGWQTDNISPFGIQELAQVPAFSGFSADLRFGGFRVRQPPLTPDCPEGVGNLYLRDNSTGASRCLTTEAPEIINGRISFCFAFAGSSEDGTRAFFGALANYPGTGAPKGDESGDNYNLYESSVGGGLKLVSVLPASQGGGPAPPSPGTSYGQGGLNCQVGQTILRHVVSADGSRAIWTFVPPNQAEPSQLFVRVDGTETVQLDKKVSGGGASGKGFFWAASADGSVVYFTDENKLISGSKGEPGAPDLYRYAFGQSPSLVNLTKETTSKTAADVRGVVGASDDGSYVYFVANGVLTEVENTADQKAQAGKPNLYLYHDGSTRFIATLSAEDIGDWETQPKSLTARVTPDGRHLVFLSIESKALVGYDNTSDSGPHCRFEAPNKIVGGPLCSQAFVYDADSGILTCASCNPSGARPLGPTTLPGWANVYEGPRYLSDDGSRLFFESFDALTLGDGGPTRAIYEFEFAGAGTCSADNANFDPTSGGCHFLIASGRNPISSGMKPAETYLVDASSNGRDVFFSTRDQLVGWDVNPNYDIYDSREGGGFAEPPVPQPPCEGEACKPAPSAPPVAPGPATPGFHGPGNIVEKPRRPCKPRKAKPKHKKKHGRACHKRGSRR
jgi:hypothetical protein